MEQLQRIEEMEAILDRAGAAVEQLQEALSRYIEVQGDLSYLAAYYEGPLWRQDLADDEAGKLPQGLKRGVLSQDAVYELLSENDALLEMLRAFR